MNSEDLTIAHYGKRWGVCSHGEVLIVTQTKKAATDLARSAADILKASGIATEVKVAAEPRSFRAD